MKKFFTFISIFILTIFVGENKEIGFMLNPEEEKAQLGFKMKFAEAGAVGFIPEEMKKLTLQTNENYKTIDSKEILLKFFLLNNPPKRKLR